MTSTPPPRTFLDGCPSSSGHIGGILCSASLWTDCAQLRRSINLLTEKKLKGSLAMLLFLFCFFFFTFDFELDSGILLSSLKQACIFSLNFSGEIFRRTGHLSQQLCKITNVLWPCFMYRKIISRTCVQSKMGQPSFCFSSWWLC